MRIRKMEIQEITFVYTTYEQELYESIRRIGLSFPIKISQTERGFVCVDGNKRLSILQDLKSDKLVNIDVDSVHCIIINDGSTRSNDCWRNRNTH